MDSSLSNEAKNFSPGKGILNGIVSAFLGIMGSIAVINGIFSLLHIWFGLFEGKVIRVGRNGASLELMEDLPSALIILGIGLLFRSIVRVRKQAKRQNWYRSHRLTFRIGFIIVMIPIGRGAYRGIIAAEGGSGIYAAQQCDTDTIRDLNEKGEIPDTDKNEMLMWMAQRGCSDTLSYVLGQGRDANATKTEDGAPLVNIAGSFGDTKTVMAFIDHGANVNSVDKDISLIMRVLQNSNMTKDQKKSLIKKLVEKGANLYYSTPDGLSIDQLAKSAGVDLSSL